MSEIKSINNWQSERNCKFPQQEIVDLGGNHRVSKIRILSHEHMIASKVEFFFVNTAENDSHFWRRLGSVQFDENVDCEFRARELKTIYVDIIASSIQLQFHEPYVNAKNDHCQIKFISIQIFGDTLEGYTDVKDNVYLASRTDKVSNSSADGGLLPIDSGVAKLIVEIEEIKLQAINEENYDKAKVVKDKITALRNLGGELYRIDEHSPTVPPNRKKLALIEEDYDLAKSLKQKIESMQQQILNKYNDNDSFDVLNDQMSGQARELFDDMNEFLASTNVPDDNNKELELGESPLDWPSELPVPSMPTVDISDLEKVIGRYAAAALLSRKWQLRQAAIDQMSKKLEKLVGLLSNLMLFGGLHDTDATLLTIGVAKIVRLSVADNVPNIFQSGLKLLERFIKICVKEESTEYMTILNTLLPTLQKKIGESNVRIQNATSSFMMMLAGLNKLGFALILESILQSPSNSLIKQKLACLQLLQSLYQKHLASFGNDDSNYLFKMAQYLSPLASHANSDVRNLSLDLLLKVQQDNKLLMDNCLSKEVQLKLQKYGKSINQQVGLGESDIELNPHVENQHKNVAKVLPEENTCSNEAKMLEAHILKLEHELGPDHVEVGTHLSKLAVIYGQEGAITEAQQLYERALFIFEDKLGAFNSTVAHTLTDLAIVHLEKGNMAAGRPLLERALVIHEKLLGPHHPDVEAIKEVLNDD